MGAIGDRAKQFIPITWDMLTKDTNRYGPALLQGRVDRAKYELLGTSAPPESLEHTLAENTQEYLAKKSVLKIIPAGIEGWADQPISVNTTGTSEVVSYESRILQLRELFKQLSLEIAQEEVLLDPPVFNTRGYPAVSDGQNEILVTANPHGFPPQFNPGGEET